MCRLPKALVLGAPPVPPHHVEWVLAAAAGTGGLAPEFPFLPVPTKNRDGKDASRFVRQCWGGRLCRHRPPISGHVIPNPQFPLHMPLLLTASLCWASCCLDSASSENILVGLELGRGRGRATECRQRPNLLGLFLSLLQVKWGLWDKAAGSGTFRVGKGPRSPDREWNPRDPGW